MKCQSDISPIPKRSPLKNHLFYEIGDWDFFFQMPIRVRTGLGQSQELDTQSRSSMSVGGMPLLNP